MRLPRGTRLLTRPQQIDAVSSPIRVEILEQLGLAGPSSVARLAAVMGRPPSALHYHVNLLHRAGLIRAAGREPAGRGDATRYALTANHFAVAAKAGAAASRSQVERTLAATLRLSSREAMRAIRGATAHATGGRRTFHARRLRGPLSADALRRVNGLLDEHEMVFDAARREAKALRPAGAPPAASTRRHAAQQRGDGVGGLTGRRQWPAIRRARR